MPILRENILRFETGDKKCYVYKILKNKKENKKKTTTTKDSRRILVVCGKWMSLSLFVNLLAVIMI